MLRSKFCRRRTRTKCRLLTLSRPVATGSSTHSIRIARGMLKLSLLWDMAIVIPRATGSPSQACADARPSNCSVKFNDVEGWVPRACASARQAARAPRGPRGPAPMLSSPRLGIPPRGSTGPHQHRTISTGSQCNIREATATHVLVDRLALAGLGQHPPGSGRGVYQRLAERPRAARRDRRTERQPCRDFLSALSRSPRRRANVPYSGPPCTGTRAPPPRLPERSTSTAR